MAKKLVVGFDLDMTLFNTRLSIAATLTQARANIGVVFDVTKALTDLGPPLEDLVGIQLAPRQRDQLVAEYRRIYHVNGVPAAHLLPGARKAIDAVHNIGGDVIVITGKNRVDAKRHIDHEKLDVQEIIGWAWADGKTRALLSHDAAVYIGDHPVDMVAAKEANCKAVAVTTGTHSADEFNDVDTILSSLTQFPQWLTSQFTAQ